MNGFANALSFKDLDNTDIVAVEYFVREKTLKILQQKLSNSINEENCDVLVDDEELEQYFGPVYMQAPAKFKFLPGEIKLIKELAAHVKRLVDVNGLNIGLKQFKPKRMLKRAIGKNSNVLGTQVTNTNGFDEKNLNELFPDLNFSLFAKVIEILKQYKVDQEVNINNISSNTVSVVVKNNHVNGDIYCVLCQNDLKGNKQNPKRISYKCMNGYKFWIPSNFTTHLKNIHGLSAEKKMPMSKNNARIKKPKLKSKTDDNKENNLMHSPMNDQSILIVDDGATGKKSIIGNLYEQISTQITCMSQAVLENNDEEHEMLVCLFAKETTTIKIVNSIGDGNCLFNSLTHQLFRFKMGSTELKKAAVQLRAQVVAQIQQNITVYYHELKGRIFDIKDEQKINGEHSDSDSIDMEKEIQFFVHQLLPKNGYWGGSESIKAVSDLYNVNIILFFENESFTVVFEDGMKYEKTIAVAFRYGIDGVRNHYDSVTDIASNDIYTMADPK